LAAHNAAAAAAAAADQVWPAADAALSLAPLAAALAVTPTPLYAVSEGLEAPIQLIYLLSLLGFLAVGAYLVVRQVLVRRELDEAAKALGERIRTGAASCEVCALLCYVGVCVVLCGWGVVCEVSCVCWLSEQSVAWATCLCRLFLSAPPSRPAINLVLSSPNNSSQLPPLVNNTNNQDYYELGVILTRKKLFTQATKNLEKAKKVWDGDAAELAQVHNALGFCYFQMAKVWVAVGCGCGLWLVVVGAEGKEGACSTARRGARRRGVAVAVLAHFHVRPSTPNTRLARKARLSVPHHSQNKQTNKHPSPPKKHARSTTRASPSTRPPWGCSRAT
jgi:hypothetical protein